MDTKQPHALMGISRHEELKISEETESISSARLHLSEWVAQKVNPIDGIKMDGRDKLKKVEKKKKQDGRLQKEADDYLTERGGEIWVAYCRLSQGAKFTLGSGKEPACGRTRQPWG